jgi:hypothetical protein
MVTWFYRLLACAGLALAVCGGSAEGRPNRSPLQETRAELNPSLSSLLLSDMSQPSERMPEGVPAWYDWAGHPRARRLASPSSFRAFTAWGQLYQCAGTSATDAEVVEFRDLQSWTLLRGSGKWRRIQFSSQLEGGAFPEDYVGPTLPARYVSTASKTLVRPVAKHNFHFWPGSGRVSIRPARVVAIVVAVEARLRARSAGGTEPPCLVLSVGGDAWRSLSAPPGGGNSADVGIGRFKRVQRRWRLFTMTTASSNLLDRFPPPAIAPPDQDS